MNELEKNLQKIVAVVSPIIESVFNAIYKAFKRFSSFVHESFTGAKKEEQKRLEKEKKLFIKETLDDLNRKKRDILFFYHHYEEHEKFRADIETSFSYLNLEKLNYLLGVYFGNEYEQKVIALIDFTAQDKKTFSVTREDLNELFFSFLPEINRPDLERLYAVQFLSNLLHYNVSDNYTSSEIIEINDAIADEILELLGIQNSSLQVTNFSNISEAETVAERLNEEAIFPLASIALKLAKQGKEIEGLGAMVLALSKARELDFRFKDSDKFKYNYLLYLVETNLKQVATYILRTDDIIMVPFETHKAELEKQESGLR